MDTLYLVIGEILLPFSLGLLCVWYVHPWMVRIAEPEGHRGRAVEPETSAASCSNSGRSLRISGCGCRSRQYECFRRRFGAFVVVMAMTVMLYTGTMDDILGLTPRVRFMIEIATVVLLIVIGHYRIDDFHGLWGLGSHSDLDFCAAYCFRVGWHHQRDQPDRRRGRAFVGLLHSCVRAVRGIVLPFGRQ